MDPFLTERVKLERAKYHLHVKIYPSRSTVLSDPFHFFARENGPLKCIAKKSIRGNKSALSFRGLESELDLRTALPATISVGGR